MSGVAARTLDNSPSWKGRQSEKVGSLQLLSTLVPGHRPARNIVVATSLTPQSVEALTWVIQQLVRPGDGVHLVHVVTCLHPDTEIFIPGPGNAFRVADQQHHERRAVLRAQADIKARLLPPLDAAGVPYEVHMFVDTENAPRDAIGRTILRLATELGAAAIVMAANDQVGWEKQKLGGVAAHVASQQPQPTAADPRPHSIPVVLLRC